MKVRFVRKRSIVGAGSKGPFTRVFEIGDVVSIPDGHARAFIAQGDAVLDNVPARVAPAEVAEPADQESDAPAPAPKKKPAPRKRSK